MRQVYLREVKRTEPGTESYYTYDRPVDAGFILVLTNLDVSWPEIATTEGGQFFIESGGQRVFLGGDVASITGGGSSWHGHAAMGEHSRIGVYTPASAEDDVIRFSIVGELWDKNSWNRSNIPVI